MADTEQPVFEKECLICAAPVSFTATQCPKCRQPIVPLKPPPEPVWVQALYLLVAAAAFNLVIFILRAFWYEVRYLHNHDQTGLMLLVASLIVMAVWWWACKVSDRRRGR